MIELFRAIADVVESRYPFYQKFWQSRAQHLGQHIERQLKNANEEGSRVLYTVLHIVERHLSVGSGDNPMAISTDKVRSDFIRLFCKILAVVLGIILAFSFKIDMVELVRISTQKITDAPGSVDQVSTTPLGLIVTGIAIGFGSGPVHKLITTMEKARRARKTGKI